jgi:thymidylate synthase (FAD)
LWWEHAQRDIFQLASIRYELALANGIAKEQARTLLPEGLTPSRLYMAGTLRSWIHYCQLRLANGTQREHADIAAQAWEIVRHVAPSVVAAVEVGDE